MPVGKVDIALTGQLGNWLFLTAAAVRELGRERLASACNAVLDSARFQASNRLFSVLCPWLPVTYGMPVSGRELNTRQKVSSWQSLRAIPCREMCRELFRLPDGPRVDTPVLHVRGSDYMTFFGGADVSATVERLEMCAEGLGARLSSCMVVTDDPAYVRSLGVDAERIVHRDIVFDFLLMAYARRLAISPSTFSWWAGFLGTHDRVVFPRGFGPWDAGVLDGDPFSAHSNDELCWGGECRMVGEPMHYAETAYVLICTGRYKELFDGFYKSFKEYVKGDVKLYVLTEDMTYFSRYADVRCLPARHGRWPYAVLNKYNTLLACRTLLSRHRSLVLLQANMRFVQDVDYSGLSGLMLCYHPNNGDRKDYVCGGLVGGDAQSLFGMASWVDSYIRMELEAGRMPKWHDETAVNEYWRCVAGGRARCEPSCTMYAEERPDTRTADSKIMLVDKNRFFGCDKLHYAL